VDGQRPAGTEDKGAEYDQRWRGWCTSGHCVCVGAMICRVSCSSNLQDLSDQMMLTTEMTNQVVGCCSSGLNSLALSYFSICFIFPFVILPPIY
jgi:hypothetical protein